MKKVREKESRVLFTNNGEKNYLCSIGVGDASYHQDDRSVAGEMIMLGNQRTGKTVPIYWRSGVIRKVCVSPKAAKTRSLLRLMNDGVHMAKQFLQLLNVKMKVRLFTDSHPLLESIGSSGQIEENH